jgi:aminoglycoside phosphotransferase (APT) family kinase protein
MNDICNDEAYITDDVIRPDIVRFVHQRFDTSAVVEKIRRTPVEEDITTAKCDILSVELSSGATLILFLKKYGQRIRGSVNSRQWRRAKNRREIFAYRDILPLIDSGSPSFVGAAIGQAEQDMWLMVEFVAGTKVAYFSEMEYWYVTAAWQAKFHSEQQSIDDQKLRSQAFRLDEQHFYDTANEMYEKVRNNHPVYSAEAKNLKERVHALAEVLMNEPLVWVHGAFMEHNILIRSGHGQLSSNNVCPIDWEWCGLGPRLYDLSRITHGYELEDLNRFIKSYRDEAERLKLDVLPANKFILELYRFRAYWWCRRVRDLIAWDFPAADVEAILRKSAQDARGVPE